MEHHKPTWKTHSWRTSAPLHEGAGPCGQRATSPPSLIATLGFFCESLGDALFQEPEEVLDIGKGSRWIVVVVLETMLVVLTVRCNLIDHEPCLLHRCTTMFELAAYLIRSLFRNAIEAEGLSLCRTVPRIGAVPTRWRVKNRPRTLHDPHVGFRDRRPSFGVIAASSL